MSKFKIIYFLILISFNFSLSQDKVPNTDLLDLNKNKVSSDEVLKEDKYYILSFWATWCIPCINELDAISKNYSKWLNEGIEVLAISTDDYRTKKRVRPMLKEKNWSFKFYLDENHFFKNALDIDGIPHTVVTKGKKIIKSRNGYSAGEELDLLKFIQDYKSKMF